MKNYVEAFYKDYDVTTDQRILTEMFKLYNNEEVGDQWIPSVVRLSPKYAKLNAPDRYAADLFKNQYSRIRIIC